MMSKSTTFFINRFVITKSSKTVYDQLFHRGVNIIRGANSVGKSTIMDLLFNCLGGDIAEDRWNKEARCCEWLSAEIELNGHLLTIGRPVEPGKKPPMYFFDGPYQKALENSGPISWNKYGLIRTDEKLSFSQKIFELLDWPQSQTDEFANLTIHQILRLIYVDQGTAVNKILRAEHTTFDKPSMRQAIGDFLLGLDDLGVYALKQKLAKADSDFSKIEGQLESIYRFVSPTEGVLREEHFIAELAHAYKEQHSLMAELEVLISAPDQDLNEKLQAEAKEISQEISTLTKEIDSRTSRRAELVNEIIESELFITAIDSRIKALKESKTAYDFFGEVRFKFCPSCLSLLSESNHEKCHLCKNKIDSESRHASYLAALNELTFQKRESTQILDELKANLSEHSNYLDFTQQALQSLKSKHIITLRIGSERMLQLNALSANIGALDERIKNLESKTKLVSAIEGLVQQKQKLNEVRQDFAEQIRATRTLTNSRREKVEFNLSEKTKTLLEKDGGFEDAFSEAQTVLFDFAKDMMLVDGRSKFSASSETVLKNSFHLAILQESLEDNNIRYPRLLLLDNTEDKGMGPERSQNFQKVLVESLSINRKPYQVIMTTSMIDPVLDLSSYCVGPHYAKGMHTLDLK